MKPSEALRLHREDIRRVVESRRASNPRVFGSVLHGADTEESDLDILVDPTPETSIFDIGEIRYQLRTLLGVSVDPGRCMNGYGSRFSPRLSRYERSEEFL